jgi:TolA-binding protein
MTFDPAQRDDPWFSGEPSLEAFGHGAPVPERDPWKLRTLGIVTLTGLIWLGAYAGGLLKGGPVPASEVPPERLTAFVRKAGPTSTDAFLAKLGPLPGLPAPEPPAAEPTPRKEDTPGVDEPELPPEVAPTPAPPEEAPEKATAPEEIPAAPREPKPTPPPEAEPPTPKPEVADVKPLRPTPEPAKPEPPKEAKPVPPPPVEPLRPAVAPTPPTPSADPKENELLARAEALMKAGNPKGSINELKQVIKTKPSTKARYMLGQAYNQASLSKDAEREFQAVLAANSSHKGALMRLGELAQTNNNRSAARKYYQRIVDADPDSREAAVAKKKLQQL